MANKKQPKKSLPNLDNNLVNINLPDRGEGDSTMTLLLSHPTKTAEDLKQDVRALWALAEQEEWESDDVLEQKLVEAGYTSHPIKDIIWVDAQ